MQIEGIDAIRQDAINSDNQMSYTSKTGMKPEASGPLGKDVSTIIGRIEQVMPKMVFHCPYYAHFKCDQGSTVINAYGSYVTCDENILEFQPQM